VCLSWQTGRDHHEIPICPQKDCTMNNFVDIPATAPQSKAPFTWARRLARSLANSLERARTRRLLAQLNDRQISDLGITHSDRHQELNKPFWR
jgi:uncharacterized protein YjiS (DUF1127 family)